MSNSSLEAEIQKHRLDLGQGLRTFASGVTMANPSVPRIEALKDYDDVIQEMMANPQGMKVALAACKASRGEGK